MAKKDKRIYEFRCTTCGKPMHYRAMTERKDQQLTEMKKFCSHKDCQTHRVLKPHRIPRPS
ncbi:hypothetical protein COX05_00030 [candidate division WWE3 bacterium CG22_combo_CG10-13_8_21_14_all_39_12]|uniref:50S ribosomal protein L33 n=2 Tax=Katanobacteria TaxID=422282 RepID=A0A2M7X2H4_UNCKA|nr:MAG: hypothetical protein COX05_00030 [candidate division WWE3 bacterium CG22_combo_CG10-13_8_21_14_all_39_12]PJA40372.1 MAG: hypothetical protein CO179_02425 [candidate division WWE3 bacterium CG_4_9_14_3_um_filter_39_7]